MNISVAKYSMIEKLSKKLTVWFCWLWMLFVLYLGFQASLSQIYLLLIIPIGFLPYVVFYNWYVKGVLFKKVVSA
jgi:uncharacterized membrane protein YedE/YeeE